MQHKVLVDYQLAVAQQGFIVRALLKLAGKAPSPSRQRVKAKAHCRRSSRTSSQADPRT